MADEANQLFTVPHTDTGKLFSPEGSHIIFHTVNKSGSMAASRTLSRAYELAGRQSEFVSHYELGGSTEEYVGRVLRHSGSGFFLGHYLYGQLERRSNQTWVTQFRHPLPRILSVYQWLKNKHERQSSEKFPELRTFIEKTKGIAHSQIVQFGVGFDKKRKAPRPPGDILLQSCIENLERDIHWFGIAEHFEESLFSLASVCGLPAIPAWVRDNRNPGRPLATEISQETVQLIQETYSFDFALYEYVLGRFKAEFAPPESPELEAYRKASESQYKDRVLQVMLPGVQNSDRERYPNGSDF